MTHGQDTAKEDGSEASGVTIFLLHFSLLFKSRVEHYNIDQRDAGVCCKVCENECYQAYHGKIAVELNHAACKPHSLEALK